MGKKRQRSEEENEVPQRNPEMMESGPMMSKLLRLVEELVTTTDKLRAEATGISTKKAVRDLISSLNSTVSQKILTQ